MMMLIFCLGKLFAIAAAVALVPALLLGGLAACVNHDLGLFVFIFVFGLAFSSVLAWMFRDSNAEDEDDDDDDDYVRDAG